MPGPKGIKTMFLLQGDAFTFRAEIYGKSIC